MHHQFEHPAIPSHLTITNTPWRRRESETWTGLRKGTRDDELPAACLAALRFPCLAEVQRHVLFLFADDRNSSQRHLLCPVPRLLFWARVLSVSLVDRSTKQLSWPARPITSFPPALRTRQLTPATPPSAGRRFPTAGSFVTSYFEGEQGWNGGGRGLSSLSPRRMCRGLGHGSHTTNSLDPCLRSSCASQVTE